MIDKTCNNCGETFQIYKSRAENGRGKFCSKECQYKNRNTQKEFVCDKCGVISFRQETRLNRYENNFCSDKCSQQYHQQENHPMWDGGSEKFTHTPEGRKWRAKVFERDAYTCQDCGKFGENTYLNPHHIEHLEDAPEKATDVENGVTLCVKCHANRHEEPTASLILSQKT